MFKLRWEASPRSAFTENRSPFFGLKSYCPEGGKKVRTEKGPQGLKGSSLIRAILKHNSIFGGFVDQLGVTSSGATVLAFRQSRSRAWFNPLDPLTVFLGAMKVGCKETPKGTPPPMGS